MKIKQIKIHRTKHHVPDCPASRLILDELINDGRKYGKRETFTAKNLATFDKLDIDYTVEEIS